MKKILAVDDSKTMRDMVKFTLQSSGFEVTQAEDGKHALDVLDNDAGNVDIIITDLNMPNMNGFELIRKLRAQEKYKYTPILILTTEGDPEKRKEGKEAGATGWIVKPFDPSKLISVVNKVSA